MHRLLLQISEDTTVNQSYDVGYKVGFIVGKFLPFIILGILVFLIVKYLKKRKHQ